MSQYAISDIHGCIATFKALLDKIKFSKEDELYLLGDYIDRGPDSKGVIDYIWDLQKSGYQVHCLRGNHENMLLQEVINPIHYYRGEPALLKSFGITNSIFIPNQYIKWMSELHYYMEIGNYILVHAGLNFDVPNPLEAHDDMIWIRNFHTNINKDWLNGRIIIHGHTPQRFPFLKRGHQQMKEVGAINIDGGCVFNTPGLGQLCAFELNSQELIIQKNVE